MFVLELSSAARSGPLQGSQERPISSPRHTTLHRGSPRCPLSISLSALWFPAFMTSAWHCLRSSHLILKPSWRESSWVAPGHNHSTVLCSWRKNLVRCRAAAILTRALVKVNHFKLNENIGRDTDAFAYFIRPCALARCPTSRYARPPLPPQPKASTVVSRRVAPCVYLARSALICGVCSPTFPE